MGDYFVCALYFTPIRDGLFEPSGFSLNDSLLPEVDLDATFGYTLTPPVLPIPNPELPDSKVPSLQGSFSGSPADC